jgi:hypothetical protein
VNVPSMYSISAAPSSRVGRRRRGRKCPIVWQRRYPLPVLRECLRTSGRGIHLLSTAVTAARPRLYSLSAQHGTSSLLPTIEG